MDFNAKFDDFNEKSLFEDSLFQFDDVNPFGVENSGVTVAGGKKQSHIVLRKLKERLKTEIKDKLGAKIKPINARVIGEFIPEIGEFTFFLMNGNCQFADFILEFHKAIAESGDAVTEFITTTLSLNDHSINTLDKIPGKKYILVSSYFLATDKASTLPRMKSDGRLEDYEIGFFRNHTKIVLIKTKRGNYVFCGSANLRSSATIEQFTIMNSAEIYDFNKAWILPLIEKYNFNKSFAEYSQTGAASFNQMDFI